MARLLKGGLGTADVAPDDVALEVVLEGGRVAAVGAGEGSGAGVRDVVAAEVAHTRAQDLITERTFIPLLSYAKLLQILIARR